MKKGFTLMELIVVVIIIGILAMIGLPQFFKVAERGRAAEGLSALGAVRNAQLRYAAEHGVTAVNITALDMDVPTLKFFGAVGLPAAGVDVNTSPASEVANITRTGADNSGFGSYAMSISASGNVTCTDASGKKAICATLGY